MRNISIAILLTLSLSVMACGSSSDRDFNGSADEGSQSSENGGGGLVSDPTPNPNPTAALSSNPPCESLEFDDGRGGDLWLPRSESNGLPVYILNNEWQDPATVDAVLAAGGLERANFTGFANPDAGILRPHFRFSRDCRSYTGVFIVSDVSQSCEVRLPGDVCSRID